MTTMTTAERPSVLSRVTRAVARTTAPISRPLAGRRFFPLWAIVHHRGRKSRRAYSIPVAIRASADTFTIALPWGDRTEWVRNVEAAGGCTITWRGREHHTVAPTVIGLEEAAPAFAAWQRAILRAAGVRRFLRLRRT
jgi:deazaflavin-dependent oxidoreductase (nitroreductase family)